MPAFSVVICTYNRASLVSRAIDSVLDQSFRAFELIVVDDGSVDDTKAVVSAIDDDRVRYVYRDNGGLSAARNTGVEQATGGSIVFLDDDDEALPDWLAELDAGRGGDDDAVVTCGELAVDEDGRVVGTRLPEPLGAAFEGYRWLFVAGTFAVPRHAYHAAGGFAEGLQCSHQTEFALRLLPLCRARGWPVNVVEKPLIRRLLREPEARRTPARVVSGATFVLERHHERLARSPRFLGDWYATAGVAAARTGDYRNARRLLARASRTDPRNWKHHARLALALAPPLGDRVWRVRRYRAPAGEPARTG
ncbi:MAG: glycosyltransferase family 2 protein [Actinomycetota bacterium]